jgi:subtilisin family serine protease
MKKIITTLLFFCFQYISAQSDSEGSIFTYISDEAFSTSRLKSTKTGMIVSNDEKLKNTFIKHGVKKIERAVPSASDKSKFSKLYIIECSGDEQLFANELNVNNSKYFNKALPSSRFRPTHEPNDYLFQGTSDWALDMMKMKDAWEITTGDPSIRIAIIDNGFDVDHQDLQGQIVYQNGYVGTQDTAWNGVITTSTHGTAVACRAGAATNNGVGLCGTGYNCKLMLYKGLSIAHVLDAAIRGARVINCSFAGFDSNSLEQEMIDSAFQLGAIIVAGAANGRCWECDCGDPRRLANCSQITCNGGTRGLGQCRVFPASYNHVISVSSVSTTDHHETILGDSLSTHNHNDSVDICAPGYNVMTARPNNQYWTSSGTSFAAPMVAGICGLILSVNPCLTNVEVEDIIKQTAVDIYNLPDNQKYNGRLGAGRIDAYAAVQDAVKRSTLAIKDITINSNNSYNAQFSIDVSNVKVQNSSAIVLNARGYINIDNLELSNTSTIEFNANQKITVPCQ